MVEQPPAPTPADKTPQDALQNIVSLATAEAKRRAFSVLLRAVSKGVSR